MGATAARCDTACLSSPTHCHLLHDFVRKIIIEIPYRAPLRAVERTELSGSSGACVGLPFVPIRSQNAVALSERYALDSPRKVTE